ncbi:MAG: ubiquitin-like domain-containing protein [Anaerolineales bacterium]
MTPARIRWFAAGSALLVLLLGYLALNRTLTIHADGRSITITTKALTVGGALQGAGIQLGPYDAVHPAVLSLASDGLVVEVQRAGRLLLLANGEVFEDASGERRLAVLLAKWELTLGEGDRLLLAGRTISLDEDLPEGAFISLEIRRAVRVNLEEVGESTSFLSSAPTLGEALAEHGVELRLADRLEPDPETILGKSISVRLDRAKPINIRIGAQRIQLSTSATTVGEVLATAGISLQGLDYSRPAADQALPENGVIRVVRVFETVKLEQEIIPHETDWQADAELEVGVTVVLQPGQDGVAASRVRIRYEDGAEVSRAEESSRVLVEPVTAIGEIGSKFVIRTTVVDGVEIEYWATMSMYATSYSPCRSGVDRCLYGTSTSGVSVAKGVAATYRDWLLAARGVSIYVPGYGSAAFYDVGGGFPDGRAWIDLGYSDDDWVGWSQWVTVYFTTPLPASVPYFINP